MAYSAVFKDGADVYFSHVKKKYIPISLAKAGEKTPWILFLELNRYVNMHYVCILKSLQGWSLEEHHVTFLEHSLRGRASTILSSQQPWEWAFLSSPGAGDSGTERGQQGALGHAAPKGQNPVCVTQKPQVQDPVPTQPSSHNSGYGGTVSLWVTFIIFLNNLIFKPSLSYNKSHYLCI